jgi:hypothetical protein
MNIRRRVAHRCACRSFSVRRAPQFARRCPTHRFLKRGGLSAESPTPLLPACSFPRISAPQRQDLLSSAGRAPALISHFPFFSFSLSGQRVLVLFHFCPNLQLCFLRARANVVGTQKQTWKFFKVRATPEDSHQRRPLTLHRTSLLLPPKYSEPHAGKHHNPCLSAHSIVKQRRF